MFQKTNQINQNEKVCYFCRLNVKYLDYKDSELLKKFVSLQAKIKPTRRSRCCSRHQRSLAIAIKRSRYMSLMPYVNL